MSAVLAPDPPRTFGPVGQCFPANDTLLLVLHQLQPLLVHSLLQLGEIDI